MLHNAKHYFQVPGRTTYTECVTRPHLRSRSPCHWHEEENNQSDQFDSPPPALQEYRTRSSQRELPAHMRGDPVSEQPFTQQQSNGLHEEPRRPYRGPTGALQGPCRGPTGALQGPHRPCSALCGRVCCSERSAPDWVTALRRLFSRYDDDTRRANVTVHVSHMTQPEEGRF